MELATSYALDLGDRRLDAVMFGGAVEAVPDHHAALAKVATLVSRDPGTFTRVGAQAAPRGVGGKAEYARYEAFPPPCDASTWIPGAKKTTRITRH
jgi:hypothetical protein